MAVPKKKPPESGFARAKSLQDDADEKANREQNQKADLEALESQRNDFRELEKLALQYKVDSEANKNSILGWLPHGVCLTTLVILGGYFYLLHKSGLQGNNFELPPVVLSSVGATAVSGSFLLIGYMLKGVFQVSQKPRKTKSRQKS